MKMFFLVHPFFLPNLGPDQIYGVLAFFPPVFCSRSRSRSDLLEEKSNVFNVYMVFSDSRWLGRPSLCMVVGSEIPLIFHVLVLRSCRSFSGCTILTSSDFLTDPKLLGKILLCWSSVYIFFVEHESEIA